jgi:hypothetical protein
MSMNRAEAIEDLGAVMTAAKARTPGLSSYLYAVLRWLDKSPEICVPNVDLLANDGIRSSATAPKYWLRDPARVSVPWCSCFIVTPAADEYGHAYLVRPFGPGLFHVAIFIRNSVSVSLPQFTGRDDPITRWLPSVCEYWVSPGEKIRNKEPVIREKMNDAMMGKILDAYGEEAIMPIPVDGCEDLAEISKTARAFSQSLSNLYLAMAGIGNGNFYLRETDYSEKGRPAYELRPVSELKGQGRTFRRDPRADDELVKIIHDLGQCTLCGNNNIVGGGVLTHPGETIGTVYATCRRCIGDPGHLQKLNHLLSRLRQTPKSTIPVSGVLH